MKTFYNIISLVSGVFRRMAKDQIIFPLSWMCITWIFSILWFAIVRMNRFEPGAVLLFVILSSTVFVGLMAWSLVWFLKWFWRTVAEKT